MNESREWVAKAANDAGFWQTPSAKSEAANGVVIMVAEFMSNSLRESLKRDVFYHRRALPSNFMATIPNTKLARKTLEIGKGFAFVESQHLVMTEFGNRLTAHGLENLRRVQRAHRKEPSAKEQSPECAQATPAGNGPSMPTKKEIAPGRCARANLQQAFDQFSPTTSIKMI